LRATPAAWSLARPEREATGLCCLAVSAARDHSGVGTRRRRQADGAVAANPFAKAIMPDLTSRGHLASVEEVVALLSGAITFINEVLPVINFWWRFVVLLLFLILMMDLSIRSTRAISRFPSPYSRVLLSISVFVVIIATLWTPMRKQYLAEHMPPNFVYVIPGFWSPSPKPEWFMMIRHYGPEPVYKVELLFVDQDRAHALANRKSITPDEISQEQRTLDFDEIDPTEAVWAKLFSCIPLDPDHEEFSIALTSRNGRFSETLKIERVQSKWTYAMRVVGLFGCRYRLSRSGVPRFRS
jgi:hypothetical protein